MTTYTREPGFYAHPNGGSYFIDEDGCAYSWTNTLGFFKAGNPDSPLVQELTPARVVPAEPVELTEEQVGELWDGRRVRIMNWGDLSRAKHMDVTATVNTALAKYGHGN